MKRILIFSLSYYPRFVGGAEVALKEITDRIAPEDIEFHMLTLRMDKDLPTEERIGNVQVHRIGFARSSPSIVDLERFPLRLTKYWYQFGAWWYAEKLHHTYHFDGIWAMMAHSCGVPAGLFKHRHPDVKYLLSLQEGDPPAHIERLAKPVWPWFKRGFTSADALQPISMFLLGWGRRMGFKGHAEVIPNAVDTTLFAHTHGPEEIERMRASLVKQPGDILLVTTSRLVHKNAIDEVIRALSLLPSRIHFLVYGIGPDEAALRTLARSEGVAARVHFKGEIGHGELPLVLRACDIFIRPSRSEGMGNSFIEAMAAGLPVIATQEGGIADFLFDAARNPTQPTTGWAVDKDSPAQIAAAVQDIVAHSEHVAKVTTTAKALVLEKYDWDLSAARMRQLFDRLFATR